MSQDDKDVPERYRPGAITPGDSGPGVRCPKCQSLFPLVGGPEAIKRLPDPFDFNCPRCGQASTIPKSEIVRLVAHRRQ